MSSNPCTFSKAKCSPDIDVHGFEGLSSRGRLQAARAPAPQEHFGSSLHLDVLQVRTAGALHPVLHREALDGVLQTHKQLVLHIVHLQGGVEKETDPKRS